MTEDPRSFVKIVIALQREFGVDLAEEALGGISTVGELTKYIEALMAQRHV